MSLQRAATKGPTLGLVILAAAGFAAVVCWEPDRAGGPATLDAESSNGTTTRTLGKAASNRPSHPDARTDATPSVPGRQAAALESPPLDLLDFVTDSIDAMTDEEIANALTHFTGRDREAIEEIDDPRAFAKSLSAAILSGWMTEPQLGAEIPIQFTTRLRGENAQPDEPVFASSSTRIFGTFPLDPGEEIVVLAKWYQVGAPDFLLLEELPVREQNGRGFIRLDPPGGWPEGSYRLELYESDESVDLVAAGEYQTEGHGQPLAAVFK